MPSYHFTSSAPLYRFGRPWTPAVKALILINTAVFLLQIVFRNFLPLELAGLQVPEFFHHWRFWQIFTYAFFHNDFWHLAFNMLALWMFGSEVEEIMGTIKFYIYYLVCGSGAGLIVALVGWLAGEHTLTLGASGAIFGILMAYGLLFAEKIITLLVFFILPIQIKAKHMVMIFAAIEFLAGVGSAFGRISHLAHLSGLIIGLIGFRLVLPARSPSWNLWQQFRLWWIGRRVKRIDPEEDVDLILEKISQEGLQSLSRREREILQQAARRRNNWPGAN